MTDIDKLLEEARGRAENYGLIYGGKETADDYLKGTYARLYLDIPGKYSGSVAEKDAWIRRQVDYIAAVDRKKDAYAEWKAAETYMKLLIAQVDVYRTQQANNRFLDKAHQ